MHRERKGQLAISEKSCYHVSTLAVNYYTHHLNIHYFIFCTVLVLFEYKLKAMFAYPKGHTRARQVS